MIHGIYHPKRGFYVKDVQSNVTGKMAPRFTWKRARKPESEGGPKSFDSPGAAQRWLEEKLKTPDHGMERCSVEPLK